MSTLIHDCPHCASAKMSFLIFGARSQQVFPGQQVTRGIVSLGLECQSCLKTASAKIKNTETHSHGTWTQMVAHLTREEGSYPNGKWDLVEFWPENEALNAPEFLPPQVEKAFLQGEKNLVMEGCEEAAATSFRRALDVGLKVRFPELTGDLFKKIEKLAADRVIPDSLAEWAHEVRVIGNDGAHDLEGCSLEDATAGGDFVDAVLRYLFSLPGMIAERRLGTSEETP